MANHNLLGTNTVNLKAIFGGSNIYRVPIFQRDYSWDEDHWDDLWNDIETARNTDQPHYMGSIVLQSEDNKQFSIIDGQQRFSTLSILILATISHIKDLIANGIETTENTERVNILMAQYIGHKDPSSLTYSSKLFLNENTDGFYRTKLLAFKAPLNNRSLSEPEKLMWKAFQFFKKKIDLLFPNKNGSDLASFLNNTIGELLMFIQITVEDELNAYTVFETLNSRGVELTSTDLLKNYLFSLVAESEADLNNIKTQWAKISASVSLKDFPTFLRFYISATRKRISKEYLFKEVKSFVKTKQDVFTLIDHLESYSYIYSSLSSYEDELWNTDKENRACIATLKLFRVTQWKPLIMVASEKFGINSPEFKKILQSIVVISYRYNVIAKQQTNEMEKVYSKAAINLFNNQNPTSASVINDLQDIYINDDEFKTYFSTKQFNTNNSQEKKLLRYTLYQLERVYSSGICYDHDSDSGTIEHILPESYPEIWHNEFSEAEFEKNIYMIGNLTLLEPKKNGREAANKSFSEKLGIYKISQYRITNSIEDNEFWTPRSIKYRQANLAKKACTLWKI